MSADKSSKNKTFVLEFIELYKSYPCLWKIKSKEYSNRNIKDRAYAVLIEKMKEIDENANRDAVVKKINSLRSAYRKEIKKIRDSERSGAGEEDIYTPHLWYFNEIDFIRDQEMPRDTISNMEDSQDVIVCEENLNNLSGHSFDNSADISVQSVSDLEFATPGTHLTPTDSELIPNNLKAKKSHKKQLEECDSILSVIGKRLKETTSKPENRFDLIGKTWAYKLKEINKEQIIYAEKLINDVLYEAELGNLNRHCSLTIHPNQPCLDQSPASASIQPSTRYWSQPQPPFRQSFSVQDYPQYFQPAPNYQRFPQSPPLDTVTQQSFVNYNSDQLVDMETQKLQGTSNIYRPQETEISLNNLPAN